MRRRWPRRRHTPSGGSSIDEADFDDWLRQERARLHELALGVFQRLVEHYAPFVAQETWFQPKSDYLARFDLDGDWKGDNNWANAERGSSQAYVHYAVMETDTHWFLVYNFFHPRDYSDKCVAGTCHENDNEGLILTVAKDGSPFGRLQVTC